MSSAIWRWTSKTPACYIRLSLPATRNSAQPSSPPHRLAFSDWGNILYNTTIATAIADRLAEKVRAGGLGGKARLRRPPPVGLPGDALVVSSEGNDGLTGRSP
jgi:hypothetical protein